MIAVEAFKTGMLSECYRDNIGRDWLDIAEDGLHATLFRDFATIFHKLRDKEGLVQFLSKKAGNGAEISIMAPLVTSGDVQQGGRSYFQLNGKTNDGNLVMTVSQCPWYDRALYRISAPLTQGRWMRRVECDTPEGRAAWLSEACGIPFRGGSGVVSVDRLPDIMRAFLGSDGDLQDRTYHDGQRCLYSMRVSCETHTSECGVNLEDLNHTGNYDSFITLRAKAPYQIADYLKEMNSFVHP